MLAVVVGHVVGDVVVGEPSVDPCILSLLILVVESQAHALAEVSDGAVLALLVSSIIA